MYGKRDKDTFLNVSLNVLDLYISHLQTIRVFAVQR